LKIFILSCLIILLFFSCEKSTEPEPVSGWIVYNTSNSGLPNDFVTTIVIDGSNNKWIGTHDRGLAVYNEGGVVDFLE
jgi:hypothetical protein